MVAPPLAGGFPSFFVLSKLGCLSLDLAFAVASFLGHLEHLVEYAWMLLAFHAQQSTPRQ
jgi:hypothetical protein